MSWSKKISLPNYLKYLFSFFTVLVFICCHSAYATARLSDPKNFPPEKFRILTDNVVVEGSLEFGGIQPDYLIDLSAPEFDRIFRYADKVSSEIPGVWNRIEILSRYIKWNKVEKLSRYLNRYVLPEKDFSSTPYLNLLSAYRKSQEPVPLSEYIKCRAGVCREYSMLIHLLLNRIGITNYHTYAKIRMASQFHNYDVIEDHGFIVSKIGKTSWVIDPYYGGFNGFKLEDLVRPEGVTVDSKHAPIAKPDPGFRRIVKIHDFPKVWPAVPENCSALLSHLGSQTRRNYISR